ncbi:unnamed protein product [Prunus armeniaca]
MVAVVRLGGVGGLAGYVVAGDDGDGLIGYVVTGYGFDGDAEKCKHTVSPRAPVWYRPKALRCLSLGRCAICLKFRCGTLDISCGTATCRRGGGCPNVAIGGFGTEGVPQVLLREFSEGDLELSPEGNVALPFGSPVGGRGSTLALPALFVQRLTLAKLEGRVEWMGEGTSERFDFRASRAVSSP